MGVSVDVSVSVEEGLRRGVVLRVPEYGWVSGCD